ncbi:hypothetical protein CTAYLR_004243 [Chrysophaeum taylorii]|uniref:Sulfotransferase domain-containing protein n=1 Tax=Chrysophaeum taylorii TaxID=2483200 RepID=A0AAD7XLB3_9STRA|nr:hypothetical protein CTAYLR_004243 [Chrysophaeum taylorii]
MGASLGTQPNKYVEPDAGLEARSAESIGYKLVKVRGVPQNPLFDVAKFEALIANFEARDSDVFVCTYVKAGTTWTQQILTKLLGSSKKYGEVVPWLEALCATQILPEREAPGWSLETVAAAEGPRYFKSHAVVADLPGGADKPKVIVVARNPKDTVVSLYHHAKNKPEFGFGNGTFDDFLEVFLSGNAENGSWFKHVVEWYQISQAAPDKCLFLTFEDMKRDTPGAVRQMAAFLGISADAALIQDTVANSTMKAMQETANIGLGHLRQGEIGKWRETFTVAQSDLFDKVYKIKMRGTGLVFDFGDGLKF